MNTDTKEMNKKDLTPNELEEVAGGVDRERAPKGNGNFISWIIGFLFGD